MFRIGNMQYLINDDRFVCVLVVYNLILFLLQVSEKKRAEYHEKRQKEWDQFIDDMNFKCQRIDNAFEEKEEELRDLYADLNHKLNIANN